MAIHIDLRDLRYFEAIAELGHIGRAAERLHLTQPALTRCVRRLEDMFGADLFERVGRGIRLTAAGEALLVRARRLHVAADEAAREMVDFAHGASGHVRIGLVPTAAQFLLPPVCRALLAETPDVSLKTVIGQGDVLMPALKSGELDLVISFGAPVDDHPFALAFPSIGILPCWHSRLRSCLSNLRSYRGTQSFQCTCPNFGSPG